MAPAGETSLRVNSLRYEVQALRALAVTAVLIFHLWPEVLPGGYIGVDVFFVISGFLITRMLFAQRQPSIVDFWARRLRRLVPAALLVLASGGIATLVLIPQTAWSQFFQELAASSGFLENRYLAGAAVDYFATTRDPSPFQHFWTLSVEGQVYLLWPLLLAAAVAHGQRLLSVAITAITLVSVASFAYAVAQLASEPAAAYFSTAGRIWEFGVGAILALALSRTSPSPALRTLVSWLGLAAIIAAALLLDGMTAFPGAYALLPVCGAAAVIWAGVPSHRWSASPLLLLRPVQQLGDISYAAYLWHWPLLIIWPIAAGAPLNTGQRMLVLVLTIILAAATKVLVEDPVRRYLPLKRSPRISIAATLGASAIVLAFAGGALAVVDEKADRAAEQIPQPPRCFGAASRDRQRPCTNPELKRAVIPAPLAARKSRNDRCRFVADHGLAHACAFGLDLSDADNERFDIALIGDSHASAWRGALAYAAERRGWRGVSLARSGCVFTRAVPLLPLVQRDGCVRWNADVTAWLKMHPEIKTVFVAARASARFKAPKGQMRAVAERGYRRAWRSLPKTAANLVVLRDTPRMPSDPLVCVERALAASAGPPPGQACAADRSEALMPDPQVTASSLSAAAGPSRTVRVVDLSDVLCDPHSCSPVIGGALVLRDTDHMTPTFSRTLGPFLDRALNRPIAG